MMVWTLQISIDINMEPREQLYLWILDVKVDNLEVEGKNKYLEWRRYVQGKRLGYEFAVDGDQEGVDIVRSKMLLDYFWRPVS